jgi:hypothetical protein
MPSVSRLALALALALASSCIIARQPLVAPPNDEPTVMVLSTRMPAPIKHIARHAYIAVRQPGDDHWTIWECCGPGSHQSDNPFIPSFGDGVRVHGVWRGKKAEKIIACIPGVTHKYGDPSYLPWPGPNSNTYVEHVMRTCGMHADLPVTCIGRDYRGWLGASWTSGGTGFQIESPLVGVKLGLTEGVDVHIFGLALGVDLWPPAIILPVGEGRLGFDDR